MVKKGDTFNIGEICPESGIYRITDCSCMIEKKCEISEEQLTIPLVKGKRFPPCKGCADSSIKWEFVKKA
ncbi:hypothetical protein ACFLYU_01090 [Candidatus Dependentiae bacterium]